MGLRWLCIAFAAIVCLSMADPGVVRAQTPAAAPSAADDAAQGEALEEGGAVLRDMAIDPANAVADKVILTGGDAVDTTHVVVREHSTNRALQRNNLGFFVPWDGNLDTLIDNHFSTENGSIVFKILRDGVGDLLYPLSVSIGYRTGGVMKTGHFAITPSSVP